MTALIITIITSLGEIIDQVFGSNWVEWKGGIEIVLAVITPLLVWLLPWLGVGERKT